jgi:hypothetical protein
MATSRPTGWRRGLNASRKADRGGSAYSGATRACPSRPGGGRGSGGVPGVDDPAALLRHGGEAGDEVRGALVVAEERGPLNSPHHDVVEGARGIQAGLAGHGESHRSTAGCPGSSWQHPGSGGSHNLLYDRPWPHLRAASLRLTPRSRTPIQFPEALWAMVRGRTG